MGRSDRFNKWTTVILIFLVAALLTTMIGSQVYRYLNDKHDTQEAVLCTINDDIPFDGIIVRSETPVSYDGDEIVSYSYPDGSKVSKGDVVAKVFHNRSAASAQVKLDKINEKIELLQRAQNPGTTDYVQPETISRKINEHYKQVVSYSNDKNYKNILAEKNNMLLVMDIYNIISGICENYDPQIAALQEQADKLSKQASDVKENITAKETGYFVSYCDGYEQKLDPENVMNLDETEIENIVSKFDKGAKIKKDAVGKTFSDYTCYITGIIDKDSRVAQDASLRLTLDSSDVVYNVDVVSVRPSKDEDKAIIVLSCDSLDEALVSRRVQSMQLIFGEFSGVKVPEKAIRFQGEDKGVYVILGEDISFKKIDEVYKGDGFVISKNTSDEEYLNLYDQILLEVVTQENVRQQESAKHDSGSDGSSDVQSSSS